MTRASSFEPMVIWCTAWIVPTAASSRRTRMVRTRTVGPSNCRPSAAVAPRRAPSDQTCRQASSSATRRRRQSPAARPANHPANDFCNDFSRTHGAPADGHQRRCLLGRTFIGDNWLQQQEERPSRTESEAGNGFGGVLAGAIVTGVILDLPPFNSLVSYNYRVKDYWENWAAEAKSSRRGTEPEPVRRQSRSAD